MILNKVANINAAATSYMISNVQRDADRGWNMRKALDMSSLEQAREKEISGFPPSKLAKYNQ